MVLAVESLDKLQDQVNTRDDARRRPHVAVDDPARGRRPLHAVAQRHDGVPRGLVGRRAFPVEHARPRGDARARADRDEVLDPGVGGAHKVDGGRDVADALAAAAGYKEHVEVLGRVGERMGWADGELEVGAHGVLFQVGRAHAHGLLRLGDEAQVELHAVGEEV